MTSADGSIHHEPKNIDNLREFLKANKEKYHEIWIVLIKKDYANPQPVSFKEAVNEAISQGLVDSRTQTLDNTRYAVRFTKRKNKKV